MMETADIEALIKAALPDAEIRVMDTTGTKDHFRVEVVSLQFDGKSRIDQHRMVQDCLKSAVDDGRIHALSISTHTP